MTSVIESVSSPADRRRRPRGPRLAALPVEREADLLHRYRGSAIGDLLTAHNLGRSLPTGSPAELLVITGMDHRVSIDLPESFAYQIRTAGATPEPVLSHVAFAVVVAGVTSICVIAHSTRVTTGAGCVEAMTTRLVEREGWAPDDARAQAERLHHAFRIPDPIRVAWTHAGTLAACFPSCTVAPLLYRFDDGALLQVAECAGADDDAFDASRGSGPA